MTAAAPIAGSRVRPFPGQRRSGDGVFARTTEDVLWAGVIDALGHGPEAADTADAVLGWLASRDLAADLDPLDLLADLHRAQRGGRGAAVTLAKVTAAGKVRVAGIGNVQARLIGPTRTKTFLCQDGNLGHGEPPLRGQSATMTPGESLLISSDGVRSRFDASDIRGFHLTRPEALAALIVRQHGKAHDDASALVIRLPR